MSSLTIEKNLDTQTNKNIGNGFAALQVVTVQCHSILNTLFTPPSHKPDWFDSLNGALDNAKLLAKQWIDDLAPDMTSSIPTHVLDYAPTYEAMTNEIISLIQKDPTAKGKGNPTIQQVFALIQALHDAVTDIVNDVKNTETRLKEWGDKMQNAHDALYGKASNIQNAELELSNEILKMNTAIQTLRAKINSENQMIAAAGIAIGMGILALVAGIALAIVSGGAGIVVAGIGAAAIIGGGVTWGIMQHEIDEQLSEIREDQLKIAEDKRQLVALSGLSTASAMAIDSMETALEKLSDVRTMWATFQGELKGVMDKLEKADEELFAVVNKGYILAAQEEWKLAVEFANQLTGVNLQVETRKIAIA
jgi:hypothetical protein